MDRIAAYYLSLTPNRTQLALQSHGRIEGNTDLPSHSATTTINFAVHTTFLLRNALCGNNCLIKSVNYTQRLSHLISKLQRHPTYPSSSIINLPR
jgi:hypothetical protein